MNRLRLSLRLQATKTWPAWGLNLLRSRAIRGVQASASSYSTARDKLRILFCGTDDFSIQSLQALHDESKKTDLIKSIDVVTRSDKSTGRGLKKLTPPPIKKTALDLNLPLHQIDTFEGWTPPDINLIIAVSFGLLIPLRILSASQYGGLNIHPSLLPDLRGAAPIQWAIIQGRRYTGVSLQTLHATKFDEGVVLDQSQRVPIDDEVTESELSTRLAPLGAGMLVKAIRDGLYLPPYRPVQSNQRQITLAPKIRSKHLALNFQHGKDELCRRGRALGQLYAFAEDQDGKKLRVKFGGIRTTKSSEPMFQVPIGVPYASVKHPVMHCPDHLLVNTKDGTIFISEVLVEGKSIGPAVQRSAQSKLLANPQETEEEIFYQFLKPLSIE